MPGSGTLLISLVVPADDLDALVRAFDQDGFVNGGPILTAAEVEELRNELELYMDTCFRNQPRDVARPFYSVDVSKNAGDSHFQLCGMWKVSAPFRKLIENPRLVELSARLSRAKTLQIWSDTVQYKPATHGAPFQWHQDAPYHISIEPSSKLLAAWVAFDDADVDTGCMWMVPGSHRWGEQERHLWSYFGNVELEGFGDLAPPPDSPEIAAAWRGVVPCPVKAGEVHFHQSYTWHGSPANRSSRIRRGYTLHYMPEGVRVSNRPDVRVPHPAGMDMIEAGADFPVVYRASP